MSIEAVVDQATADQVDHGTTDQATADQVNHGATDQATADQVNHGATDQATADQVNHGKQTRLHPLKSMSELELEKAVQASWKKTYGEDATSELLTLGERLSEYANRGTSKSKRFDRACDVIRMCCGGLFGQYEQKRIRYAVVAWHLSQRIADLKKLPVSYLQTVVEATGIGVDWKLVTDNATPVQVDRLGKVLPLLVDRTLGTVEGKSAVMPKLKQWRDVIRKVVNEGISIETLKQESESSPPPAVPVNPDTQPTVNQAEQQNQEQQKEQVSVNMSAPVEPAVIPSKSERLSACLAFLHECTVDELTESMLAYGKIDLLENLIESAVKAGKDIDQAEQQKQ